MRLDSLPGTPHLTYCTNIHAGESWTDIQASLAAHVPAIRRQLGHQGPFGLGLRLSGIAADALAKPEAMAGFKAWLAAEDVYVFTINAFPYGPFHGTRVKEEVYQPDWTTDERLRFTNLAADIQAALLPEGQTGSVSTVPGTFKPLAERPGAVAAMAERYVRHAAHLVDLEHRTGKTVALSIEPEPCCFIETIAETIAFFESHLLGNEAQTLLGQLTGLEGEAREAALRRHLGVCYDVCHAAIEYEDPRGSIEALDDAGIAITKLQLSAALRLPHVDPGAGADAEALLRPFDVGVYLHQVVEKRDGRITRHADLVPALDALARGEAGGEWRVHCHVPVFLADLGRLGSTRPFLADILAICREREVSPHLEVETYTWDVLPERYRGEDKATAIARELRWVLDELTG